MPTPVPSRHAKTLRMRWDRVVFTVVFLAVLIVGWYALLAVIAVLADRVL